MVLMHFRPNYLLIIASMFLGEAFVAAGAEDKVTSINKAVLNFIFPGLQIGLGLELENVR